MGSWAPRWVLALAVAAGVRAAPWRSGDGVTGCSVRVTGDLPEPQPLLLEPRGSPDVFGFKLPALPGNTLLFRRGEEVALSCVGATNHVTALAACAQDTTFVVAGARRNFSELACEQYPFHTARRTGALCNAGRATEIEIGFSLGARFYRLLEVCFDEALLSPVYTRFLMVAQIRNYQSRFPRPAWTTGDFYRGVSPNSRYVRNQQIATVGEILGDVALAEKYISRSSDYFLARGHLAAKVDFLYGAQQRATFYYVNAAPQWQTFNGGNWERLESSVRAYATLTASDLVVYTGVHGVSTLPDAAGVQRELYLHVDENGNRGMPVPRLYWKAVYNPRTRAGAVFLGVNNPYEASPGADYFLCRDVSGRMPWLLWSPDNQTLGFAYACEVDDFRRAVPVLPWFPVDSLLE
ncbi:uncharacterized protein LOC134531489 [Bacillus rossius redtenbacheri]|uniref:uncharacterized protein LOC134531489 n=1 Tax=Bacillus rossius redtenbacheri TaxID=93214 RepID=UPI002FDECD8A